MVDRYQVLIKKNLIEQATLDQALSEYEHLKQTVTEISENLKTAKMGARIDEIQAAEAKVEAAIFSFQQADWALSQKKIASPLNGYVFDTYYQIGELVPTDSPVVSLLAPQDIYVVFFVPEKQRATLQKQQEINISCDSCPPHIIATIRFISPTAEYTPPVVYSEKTRADLVYRVEANLKEEDAKRLHPGQPITIHFKN